MTFTNGALPPHHTEQRRASWKVFLEKSFSKWRRALEGLEVQDGESILRRGCTNARPRLATHCRLLNQQWANQVWTGSCAPEAPELRDFLRLQLFRAVRTQRESGADPCPGTSNLLNQCSLGCVARSSHIPRSSTQRNHWENSCQNWCGFWDSGWHGFGVDFWDREKRAERIHTKSARASRTKSGPFYMRICAQIRPANQKSMVSSHLVPSVLAHSGILF